MNIKKSNYNFEKLKKERIEDERFTIDWRNVFIISIILVIIAAFILESVLKFDYYPYRIITAAIFFIVVFIYFKLQK